MNRITLLLLGICITGAYFWYSDHAAKKAAYQQKQAAAAAALRAEHEAKAREREIQRLSNEAYKRHQERVKQSRKATKIIKHEEDIKRTQYQNNSNKNNRTKRRESATMYHRID